MTVILRTTPSLHPHSLSPSLLYIPSSQASNSYNDAVSYRKMLTAPFPTSTTTFPGKSVSSPRHVRFRSVVSFAAATEARSTSTEEQQHRPASYLSLHSMASCTTLYQILGIHAAASGEEIKAAYRRLARVCHPDVAPVDRKESSAGEFMKIHAAYCTLSDPDKRASYDRSLFPRQPPLTTTSSRFSGYSGRNWETDQCW